MKRSYFLLIVVGGAIVIIVTILFFILNNPYETINPAPQAPEELPEPENLEENIELEPEDLTFLSLEKALGATTGIDGIRLVYFDKEESKIKAAEFDGTGVQELSEKLLGVREMDVAPTKDRAWLLIDDPESNEAIAIIYDFRTQASVRLENGIKALDWSPDGQEVAYYLSREGTAPALKRVGFNGIDPRIIRDNFVVENIVIDWYDTDSLAYWLTPSSARESAIITMNIAGQSAVELAGESLATNALFSPDGQNVLVGFTDGATGKPVLSMGSTADRTFRSIPLESWIDKCTWASDSDRVICFAPQDLPAGFTYPDQDNGSLVYKDQLWAIDVATLQPQRIYDVPEYIPDATMPFLSSENSRLNFIDRVTDQIVSLDLTDKLVAPIQEEDQPEEKQSEAEPTT